MKIEEFTARYPKLYHMAESTTWQHIKNFGLLSTSAILDLHKIQGNNRMQFESLNRRDMMTVLSKFAPEMTLRDQKPMTDARLKIALNESCTPQGWYELLNSRVFLWATEARLHTLLSAKNYREVFHDVLTIDSKKFLDAYFEKIELCHMNSGNTFPIPHSRTPAIFQSLRDYPVKPSGAPAKEVAEVTVLFGIPDIANYVEKVDVYKGPTFIRTIYASV